MISKSKALVGAIVTGEMAVSAAAPAFANDFGNGGRHGWNGGGNSHRAVEMCSRVAERQASRHAYGRARVTDIRDVRDTRWGFEVRGRVAVDSRNYGRNDNGYGRGWRDGNRNRDTGSFKCRVERGRVAHIDFDGIRGL